MGEEEEKAAIPLRRVRVENFGCLRDVEVELTPLTVLVGPNDSGKSTLLRALLTLSHAMKAETGWDAVFRNATALTAQTFDGKGGPVRFEQAGQVGESLYSHQAQVTVEQETVRSRAGRFVYDALQVWRTPEGLWHQDPSSDSPQGPFASDHELPLLHPYWFFANSSHVDEFRRLAALYQPALPVLARLTSVQLYSLRPEHLRVSKQVGGADRSESDQPLQLTPSGAGLAQAIADLLLTGRDILERIEDGLRRAMPQVKRIDVRQKRSTLEDGERYNLELVTRSGARIPSHAISDGVLLFLGYLYLVLGPDPASILLVEEPETGIHPGLLRRLVQLFRDMTTGAHGGPPTQIILTTHSPVLLNLVRPEEIRIFQRDEDGATRVTPFMSVPDIEKLLDYEGPGEIWINEGEEYLVGNSRS
ncbi:MAG TPA: AAA family ATPase [Candidatus Nanopelagicales bacterium]|nr:AAA family ATPase [Candidatus Nanopelagicales bacterium]